MVGWTPLHRLRGHRLVDARGERPAAWRLAVRVFARLFVLAIAVGFGLAVAWAYLAAQGRPFDNSERAGTVILLSAGTILVGYYLAAFLFHGKLTPHDWITGVFWAMPAPREEPRRRTVADSTPAVSRPTESSEPPTIASDPSAEGVPAPPPPVIDQYELDGLLGQGGMGSVYRARDPHLGRTVALKVVSGGGQLDRFRREAQLAARVDHPHVARVYGAGTTAAGEPYMVMEHLPGLTLAQHVSRHGPCPPAVAWPWILQAAEGLRAADQFGIIHRDVKPSNLMLDDSGRVKVTDFGLSKTLGEADMAADDAAADWPADAHLTRTGAVLGTPMYMSPEQADGRPLDRRTDIYSLGLTLVYLLTGRPPYDATDVRELLRQQTNEMPPAVRDGIAGLTPGQRSVLTRMLAKSPGERFADYDELTRELRRTEPREPVLATWSQRASAEFLNAVIFAVLLTIVSFYSAILVGVTTSATTAAVYAAWIWVYWWGTGRHGCTPGKRQFRLQVRRPAGSPVGMRRSAVRVAVAYPATVVTFGILVIGAARSPGVMDWLNFLNLIQFVGALISSSLIVFRRQRRALHDWAADTIVVRLDEDEIEPRRGWRWWLPW